MIVWLDEKMMKGIVPGLTIALGKKIIKRVAMQRKTTPI